MCSVIHIISRQDMWSVHMEFVKMHGLGNDFIILDDTDHRQKNGRESFEKEKH